MLKVAKGYSLPLDLAGEATAILAKRGAGKTNTATVLAEELITSKIQTVILDPVGAWWGIRHSKDGQSEGLHVPILGGPHGDVPLEQTAGALIADVVVDSRQSLLIDLSDLPTKAAMGRFVTDFAERLFRRKGRDHALVHLILEEADSFAPQKVKGSERMQGAIEQLVRRGRARGLGVTLITQRSAVLSKDVLTQADTLIVMRTTGPHDLRAVREWVESRGDEHGREVLDSLPSLATGEGWVWNPERDLCKRIQFRARKTFDSSKTPKPGEAVIEPQAAASIDIETLGEQIKATAERVREEDPKVLKARVREAERRAAEAEAAYAQRVEVKEIEIVKEVPVFNGEIEAMEEQIRQVNEIISAPAEAIEKLRQTALKLEETVATAKGVTVAIATPPRADRHAEPPPRPTRPESRPAHEVPPDQKLGKGEQKVLSVLAEFPEGRTQNEVAFLAGYSANASTIGVILSKLRKLGLVESGQPIRPTQEGLDAIGGPVDRPSGQALLDHWLRHPRMGEGERRVLLALIDYYPEAPSHEELCEVTGYSPIASTMGVILSKLRKLGVVEKGQRRVAPELMEALADAVTTY